ncbi:MAG: hypothetical protein LBT09_11610 [Planctomycetaceae bacterium]|jgi:hypothetical protein|nr:hypothetical protein [Planctomycetaceae bacterium]
MTLIELKKRESTGYDGWYRSGSSHFEFYATPEEIMLLFNTALVGCSNGYCVSFLFELSFLLQPIGFKEVSEK